LILKLLKLISNLISDIVHNDYANERRKRKMFDYQNKHNSIPNRKPFSEVNFGQNSLCF